MTVKDRLVGEYLKDLHVVGWLKAPLSWPPPEEVMMKWHRCAFRSIPNRN